LECGIQRSESLRDFFSEPIDPFLQTVVCPGARHLNVPHPIGNPIVMQSMATFILVRLDDICQVLPVRVNEQDCFRQFVCLK
jgi:hypothetical protein